MGDEFGLTTEEPRQGGLGPRVAGEWSSTETKVSVAYASSTRSSICVISSPARLRAAISGPARPTSSGFSFATRLTIW